MTLTEPEVRAFSSLLSRVSERLATTYEQQTHQHVRHAEKLSAAADDLLGRLEQLAMGSVHRPGNPRPPRPGRTVSRYPTPVAGPGSVGGDPACRVGIGTAGDGRAGMTRLVVPHFGHQVCMEHGVDIMDEIDPMASAIDQAAEHLRSALHAGRRARVEPHALYARTSDLISVLSRAQEVAIALSDQIEKAARTHQLGSDDDRPANEHAERAACLLVQVAGEVAEAGLAADQAWTALGHLKLSQ